MIDITCTRYNTVEMARYDVFSFKTHLNSLKMYYHLQKEHDLKMTA